MVVRLLIDGYNLLHQSQLLGRARGPKWLQLARDRLIRHVAQLLDESQRSQAQFVFDAKRRSGAPMVDTIVDLIHITFAVDHSEADDLIERIIRQHPQPKLLTVVSSDHRLHRSAHARRANAIDSDVWLEQLQQRQESFQSSEITERKPEATPDQVRQVLTKLGYKPKNPSQKPTSISDSIVARADEPSSNRLPKAKRQRVRKSTREERQRANLHVDQEFPVDEPRSLEG